MKLSIRITFSILLVLLITTTESVGSAEAKISLDPMIINKSVNSGGSTHEIELTLTNSEDEATSYDVSVVDFMPTKNGQPRILLNNENNPAYGLKDWFTEQPNITIPGQSSKRVSLQYTIPSNVQSQTYYGSVLFRNSTEAERVVGMSENIAALLFVNVGNPIFSARFVKTDFTEPVLLGNRIGAEFSTEIMNTGQFMFTPQISIEILDAEGTVVDMIDFDAEGSVLPESSRVYKTNYVGQLEPSGTLTYRPVVMVDGESIDTHAATFFYAPDAGGSDKANQPQVGTNTTPRMGYILSIVTALVVIMGAIIYFHRKSMRKKLPEGSAVSPLSLDIAPPEPGQSVIHPDIPKNDHPSSDNDQH